MDNQYSFTCLVCGNTDIHSIGYLNGHPAYIVDEDDNTYVFHRVTHSKTSGGRNNIKIDNPLVNGGDQATYVVKRVEKDKKGRFSLFELELKPGVDVDNLLIKKAGGSQPVGTNNITTSKIIKSKRKKKGKKNGVRKLLNRFQAVL